MKAPDAMVPWDRKLIAVRGSNGNVMVDLVEMQCMFARLKTNELFAPIQQAALVSLYAIEKMMAE